MHLGGKGREVVSLVKGVLGVLLCECCAHYLENACCELALQDSLYRKKSSSFRDAYTSDKDVLRGEVEREGERRDGEEKGNRKGEG